MYQFVLLTALSTSTGLFGGAPVAGTCASGSCGMAAPSFAYSAGYAAAPAPVAAPYAAAPVAAPAAPHYSYQAPVAPAYVYPQAAPAPQVAQVPMSYNAFYYPAGSCPGGNCARR